MIDTAPGQRMTRGPRISPSCPLVVTDQRALATSAARRWTEMNLKMCEGGLDPGNVVRLEGRPPIVTGLTGLHRNVSTAAMVAPQLRPGLRTMLDRRSKRAAEDPY